MTKRGGKGFGEKEKEGIVGRRVDQKRGIPEGKRGGDMDGGSDGREE